MINTKKIVLLGAPGSGKGTLAQGLVNYGFVQISTGDLFRKKLSEDSDEAKQIQQLINRGELIPDEITNNLAKAEIVKNTQEGKNIILDGYPRTTEQAKYLNTICNVDYVVYLNVDQAILFERITGRLSCKQCGKVYNEYTNPPKVTETCDHCKIPLTRRRDDNKESFELRMKEYTSKTEPLIQFYKSQKSADTKFIELNPAKDDSIDSILKTVLKDIGM